MSEKLILKNLDKIYWPEKGYTKGDMINYYEKISDVILPYLKDRPLSLHRFPEGIHNLSFYQKDVVHLLPKWVRVFPLKSDSQNKIINYVICNNKSTLLYLLNLGCIEFHTWNATYENYEMADYMIFDIDPNGAEFRKVVEVTNYIFEVLDEIGLKSYCKTSGKAGLHIYVPVKKKYSIEQVRDFCKLICFLVNSKFPEITSMERLPKKRLKKIYLDFLQNRVGQTMVSPYSLRPTVNATISAPLKRVEINKNLNPEQFTIQNMIGRINKIGDLWKGFLNHSFNMENALNRLSKMF